VIDTSAFYTVVLKTHNRTITSPEKMNEKSALMLMDLAENYSFRVQNETQGYH